ncbi:alpha/beta hydrolase [Gemmatimonas groenlandica]|uniref:Alpha/beta hydrolase n=1 Tax=Gemmatimonas groenlandica TaxID=2732249 RepID=A0A6M4IP44_9BACT|nr:alpha/beta hydrolase [Gemmatimonas groenlandica]QJR36503.1 alpha/beta hydrolase [Gemmatimonas groenlandica]
MFNSPPTRALVVVTLAGAAGLAGCATKDSARADSMTAAGTLSDSGEMSLPRTRASAANVEMQSVLDQLGSMGGKPIESLTPAEARKQPTPAAAVAMVMTKAGRDTTPTAMVPGISSMDRTIPGPGGAMPTRIYTPSGPGPFAVVVYYHGGGWVIADKNVYDGGARSISKEANAIVVSVDYRLAPEHKFPAQHDDALAAYAWVVKNAASIKGDPNRIAIAGESAGGNLAVATAIAARDAKMPIPKAVIAVYPIAQPENTTASYIEHANAKPLNRAMMGWFAGHVSRTPADLQDPRINLVKANLAGLPPVTIINAQIDPLREDGAMLEQALKAANVSVERRVYDGVAHEFFGMGAVVAKAMDATQYAGARLKAAFGN